MAVPSTRRVRHPILTGRTSFSVSIQPESKRKKEEAFRYKPYSVITRVQTPPQLQPLKDKLSQVLTKFLPPLPPTRSRYSLTELMTLKLETKELWELVTTLLINFTASRAETCCQTELSFDVKPQLHRGIIAALAAKSHTATQQALAPDWIH